MWDPAFATLNAPLFEQLPLGVLVWRRVDGEGLPNLRLVGVNAAASTMLKLDFGPLLGRHMLEIFPDTPEGVVRVAAKLCMQGGTKDFGETPYREQDGTAATFMFRMVGLENGTVASFIENLTALKRAEHAARRSAEFLDAIIENLPSMVFVKSADHLRFERINRAGEALLGFDRGRLLGKTDADVFPPEQAARFLARDRAALSSSTVVDVPEEPVQAASGPRWLHTRLVPIRAVDTEPSHLLGISEDVTDRKAAEEEVRKVVAQLEAALAELDSFSYSVSHDLRAPVRAIDGFAQILLEDHGAELSAEARRVADVIAKNAVKMGVLIDDLLRFARTSRQPLTARKVDMRELALAVAEEVRVPGRDIEFRIGALPAVQGDAPLLKQVWVNLLGNAVKYTRARARAIIEVSAEGNGREVSYTVKDNGVGFDSRYAAKLFQVFQRLHAATEYEGTGVGLALVQRVVHRHGGRVSGTSTVGEGATFVFTLPMGG